MTHTVRSGLLMPLLTLSFLLGQGFLTFPQFEIGGGTNFLMPREDFNNGWGYGIDAVWNFSERYGINIAYNSTLVDAADGDSSRTVTSFVGSAELSFRRENSVHGFTSIGLGPVSGEENMLFAFGIGIKIALIERFLLRVELRDYFTDIGLPFVSFPGGRIALQGTGGSKYLELGLGVAYTLGEKKQARRGRRRSPW